MTTFRFIHAADLHLDTPFIGLGRGRGALAGRLRDASLDALDRIVGKALAVEAAFVVFAGDLYDGEERGVRAQLRFRHALGRLSEAGIKSFVVHGNHDPEGGRWTAIKAWPPGVHVFSTKAPEAVPVEQNGATIATIHGMSYAKRHTTDNLALRFPVVSGGVNVAVLHCNVGDQAGHAPYSPCSLDDLYSRGMAYWALGHVHTGAILSRDPWVVYPGNTQGRSFAPGEQGPKGATVVEVVEGKVRSCDFFATDSARFFELHESVDGISDFSEVGDRLGAAARALREANPDHDVLIRATIGGRTDLYRALGEAAGREGLRQSLDDHGDARMFWLELKSACLPPLDLPSIAAGSDLRAEVLATAVDWTAALPADLKNELRVLGASPTEALMKGLIDAAALDVIDRLTPEAD